MAFSPDIIVTGDDTPRILLVAEAKRYSAIRKEDGSQLKSYLLHSRPKKQLTELYDRVRIRVYGDFLLQPREKSEEWPEQGHGA
jgi:hypothetical protein